MHYSGLKIFEACICNRCPIEDAANDTLNTGDLVMAGHALKFEICKGMISAFSKARLTTYIMFVEGERKVTRNF